MAVWLCVASLAALSIGFAIYVFRDSRQRNENALVWAGGTAILGPLYFPMYLGRRKSVGGGPPEGDLDSNVALHFTWVWSIYMVVIIVWTGIILLTLDNDNIDRIGVSQGLAVTALLCCWIVPAAAAFLFSVVMMNPPDGAEVVGEENFEGQVEANQTEAIPENPAE
jgi:hypothetical protein